MTAAHAARRRCTFSDVPKRVRECLVTRIPGARSPCQQALEAWMDDHMVPPEKPDSASAGNSTSTDQGEEVGVPSPRSLEHFCHDSQQPPQETWRPKRDTAMPGAERRREMVIAETVTACQQVLTTSLPPCRPKLTAIPRPTHTLWQYISGGAVKPMPVHVLRPHMPRRQPRCKHVL
jgi:hypothetical protein